MRACCRPRADAGSGRACRPFDRHDAAAPEQFGKAEAGSPVGRGTTGVPHDQRPQVDPGGLEILRRYAVVADLRVGERHDFDPRTRGRRSPPGTRSCPCGTRLRPRPRRGVPRRARRAGKPSSNWRTARLPAWCRSLMRRGSPERASYLQAVVIRTRAVAHPTGWSKLSRVHGAPDGARGQVPSAPSVGRRDRAWRPSLRAPRTRVTQDRAYPRGAGARGSGACARAQLQAQQIARPAWRATRYRVSASRRAGPQSSACDPSVSVRSRASISPEELAMCPHTMANILASSFSGSDLRGQGVIGRIVCVPRPGGPRCPCRAGARCRVAGASPGRPAHRPAAATV